MVLIPNGFDIDTFRPDPAARHDVRRELGLPPETPLIGLVARYDPAKDHRTFLRAAAWLHQIAPDVHFVLCGDDVDWHHPELATWIDRSGLRGACHLLGRRHDVQRLHASFDVATLTSLSEGFPNVVGEAMACGVPCVATDVGDAAWIVGETGRIVPPRDPQALADAWHALLTLPSQERQTLGLAARARIAEHFALPGVIDQYAALYHSMARGN
jgi:glycosyltransferase involved in cell wall biosynthesis